MPDVDLQELARDLAKTSANLKRHIHDEGLRIGAEFGKNHAKAADERIRDNAAAMQRLQDLVAEFRRQRAPLERAADKAQRIAAAVRRAHYDGEKTIDVKTLLDIINAPDEPDNPTNPDAN